MGLCPTQVMCKTENLMGVTSLLNAWHVKDITGLAGLESVYMCRVRYLSVALYLSELACQTQIVHLDKNKHYTNVIINTLLHNAGKMM